MYKNAVKLLRLNHHFLKNQLPGNKYTNYRVFTQQHRHLASMWSGVKFAERRKLEEIINWIILRCVFIPIVWKSNFYR